MNQDKLLYQGPFTVSQDDGWYTVLTTTPKEGYTPNFGMGMIGYTWEEGGPSRLVRDGSRTLEDAVEAMAAKPFVDVLYIRCDWRHVQQEGGKLTLHPVWDLTLDAARRYGKRVAFRVQMSNPSFPTGEGALPGFLAEKIPMVSIGTGSGRHGKGKKLLEPRYDHPAFQSAFSELQGLLSARFDGDPLIEFVDLMMYGFWGEGHTGGFRSAYAGRALAEQTFLGFTREQLACWKRTPVAVNMQPDISGVGNDAVQKLALEAGEWMRTDSIILDEAQQIERIGARRPDCAVIIEDGAHRDHLTGSEYLNIPQYAHAGVDYRENAMHHALDAGANYWALWLEADNVERYFQYNPTGLKAMGRRLGYRMRPSWVWQRKRGDTMELAVGVVNSGVAGVPGQLRLIACAPNGMVLDCGFMAAGQPAAGRLSIAALMLPKDYTGDTVQLRAELVTKGITRPLSWACAQSADGTGGVPVRLLGRDSELWRKDV